MEHIIFKLKGKKTFLRKVVPVVEDTSSKADSKNSTEFYQFSEDLELKLLNPKMSMIPDLGIDMLQNRLCWTQYYLQKGSMLPF